MALSEKEELEFLELKGKGFGAKSNPENPDADPKWVPDSQPKSEKIAQAKAAEERPSYAETVKGTAEVGLAGVSKWTTGVAGGAAGGLGGLLAQVASGQLGTKEGSAGAQRAAEEGAAKFTYQPRGKVAQETMSKWGEWLESSKLGGLNPADAVTVGSMAGPALRQAGAGAGSAVAKAKGAVPSVNPDVASLARKAQALDIDIRPDMLTDNRFARVLGQAFEDVPLSGSKAEQRTQAFNRALIGIIGGDEKANRLTPDVFAKAMDKSGSTIGGIYEKTPVMLDEKFQGDLAKHLANTSKETADVAKIVTSYVNEIQAAAENGVIPGEALRKINSEIGMKVRGAQAGDLRRALGDLQDDMRAALGRQLSGDDLASLQDASKKYATGIKLIPMVAKSKVGDMSPAGLMQAVTSDKSSKRAMAFDRGGDVGELAKIGQLFLKEPKSSMTSERGLVYGGLLGGGAYVEPHTVAGIYGAANAYNRAGPAIARKMTGFVPGEVEANKRFGAMVDSTQPKPPPAPPAAPPSAGGPPSTPPPAGPQGSPPAAPAAAAPAVPVVAPQAFVEDSRRPGSTFLMAMRKAGGVDPSVLADMGQERGNLVNRQMPGFVKKGGMKEDGMVEWMQQNGYITQAQVDEANASRTGGATELARDKVRKALGGEDIYQMGSQEAGFEAKALAAYEAQEADFQAAKPNNWATLTGDAKEAKLDALFGPDSRPKAAPASQAGNEANRAPEMGRPAAGQGPSPEEVAGAGRGRGFGNMMESIRESSP